MEKNKRLFALGYLIDKSAHKLMIWSSVASTVVTVVAFFIFVIREIMR